MRVKAKTTPKPAAAPPGDEFGDDIPITAEEMDRLMKEAEEA